MDASPLVPNSRTHSLIYDVYSSPSEIMHLPAVFLLSSRLWSELRYVDHSYTVAFPCSPNHPHPMSYPIPTSEVGDEAWERLEGEMRVGEN